MKTVLNKLIPWNIFAAVVGKISSEVYVKSLKVADSTHNSMVFQVKNAVHLATTKNSD